MSKDTSIADIVFHLHPDTSCDDTDQLEKGLRELSGVVSVRFDAKEHAHTVVVAYDPAAVTANKLLDEVRKCDKDAVMVGL